MLQSRVVKQTLSIRLFRLVILPSPAAAVWPTDVIDVRPCAPPPAPRRTYLSTTLGVDRIETNSLCQEDRLHENIIIVLEIERRGSFVSLSLTLTGTPNVPHTKTKFKQCPREGC